MTLDQVFSLVTFATGALFYVVFIRRRLRRCTVVPKKWHDGRKAHRAPV